MSTGELNLAWARALFDELVRAGARHACVSPGSRSSPLALAVAERAALSTSVHIDERSAGFFALGHARATAAPSLLVCTSGTAGANYYPAVIEAHHSRVPLVVLTADRPPELRDTGAWQTIDQARLFGGFARWFVDVAPPADDPHLWRYLRSIAARAVAVARADPAGPVHLNLAFREPLVPIPPTTAVFPEGVGGRSSEKGWPSEDYPSGVPWVSLPSTEATLGFEDLGGLAVRIADEPRGLILAGPIDPSPGYARAVAKLAAASGYPILAEPLGGLRYGPHDKTQVITGHAAFLRVPAWAEVHAPRLVLRFGASHTWKHVAEYLDRHPAAVQVVIDPGRTWDDPTRRAALWIQAKAATVADGLAGLLQLGGIGPGTEPRHADRAKAAQAWAADWRAADATVRSLAQAYATEGDADTVAWVYPLLVDALPDGGLLYAANSMAVRDLDTFSGTSDKAIRAIANRGTAGIDGTISSALGAAWGSGAPTVLVTGDLAFLHDLNGLGAAVAGSPAARSAGLDLTIVVLNDDGGGIFAHLPIAEHDAPTFERYFRTPTGADLAAACATYGVPHLRATSPAELMVALGAGPESSGPRSGVHVIEVPIDLTANTALHRRFWSAVAAEVGR